MYEQLGNIGDFVGGIAVVVTLGYLAIQVRQNTQQQRLNQQDALTNTIADAFNPIYESENAEQLTRALANDEVAAHASVIAS